LILAVDDRKKQVVAAQRAFADEVSLGNLRRVIAIEVRCYRDTGSDGIGGENVLSRVLNASIGARMIRYISTVGFEFTTSQF